jgi:post-segregation antitoxin (ccd killing protein)
LIHTICQPDVGSVIHSKKKCMLLCAHIYIHLGHAMTTTQTTRRMRVAIAGKRATNLSLSSDVLDAAKQLEINISQVCDNYLREFVRREQERNHHAVQRLDSAKPSRCQVPALAVTSQPRARSSIPPPCSAEETT